MSKFFWWLIQRGHAGDGRAGGVLRVWLWWERLERKRHRPRPLNGGSALWFTVASYAGETVHLFDGREILSGDRVVELHLDNQGLSRAATGKDWSPWTATRLAEADLESLAQRIRSKSLGAVGGVHATSLYAGILRRYGFQVKPLPSSAATRLLRFYLVGLLAIYHPHGWEGARHARLHGWPVEAWISSDRLLERYPAIPAGVAVAPQAA